MKSYFNEKAFSNSLLGKVEYFVKNQISFDKFENDKQESTPSMELGSLVHLTLETSGKVIEKFIELDDSTVQLTPSERKMLELGNDIVAFTKCYDNKDSRKLAELLESAFGNQEDETIINSNSYKAYLTINNKINSYLDSIQEIEKKKEEGFIVLNEYGNPTTIKQKVIDCYYGAISNQDYQDLFICPNCIVREFPEQELYYKIYNIPFKSKIDRALINDTEKRIIHVDYKTYHDNYIKSFKKYNYARQLSLYEMAIACNMDLLKIDEAYTIEHYVLFINTETGQSTLEPIAKNTINAGRNGGYLKSDIYDHYTELDELDVFLNEKQLAHLIYSEVISETTKKDKHPLYRFGYLELIQIIQDNQLVEKLGFHEQKTNSLFNL